MSSTSIDESRAAEPRPPGQSRVVIEAVTPAVDGGRSRTKRVVGDVLRVEANLLVDGHDQIAGALLWRQGLEGAFSASALVPLGHDRWGASFTPTAIGIWQYTVEAWVDTFATWRWGLARKVQAGQDVTLELAEGAALLKAAAARPAVAASEAPTAERERIFAIALALVGGAPASERVALAMGTPLLDLMQRWPDRANASRYAPALEVIVDPPRARFSAWYEFFPRSTGPTGQHGTLRDAETQLEHVADLGFDVVYLPPIHPIGRAHRKGPNNTLVAGAQDPGSPWAIGAAEGGHKDVHPSLGTLEDFRRFVARARALGLEVALDIAFQASPDHPYVRQHPEWFVRRPDGSIQYAENPPKRYQDVYPFDFSGTAWRALWEELASVFTFWIEQGVRVFRVDNPHTKPLPFWRWCLDEVKQRHPDVVFLAEAFTRPKLLYSLAKAGFSQSYTYFTWRTSKAELTDYLTELVHGAAAEFLRPNLWPNTPDILPEHLQIGTRATFIARLVLAGTLSASYGIYGPPFELMERTPREGSEEYVDNEKFQLRHWDLQRSDSLGPVIKRINAIRRQNPALHDNASLCFHHVDNDLLIAYSKRSPDGANLIVVVVNLDAQHRQVGWLDLDLAQLQIAADETFQVHDLLSDARFLWRGPRAYIEIDPATIPAHVFVLRRRARSERTFEYYL